MERPLRCFKKDFEYENGGSSEATFHGQYDNPIRLE